MGLKEQQKYLQKKKNALQYLNAGDVVIKNYNKHIHVSSVVGLIGGTVATYYTVKGFFSHKVDLDYYGGMAKILWSKNFGNGETFFYKGKEFAISSNFDKIAQGVMDSSVITGLSFITSSLIIGGIIFYLKLKFAEYISKDQIDDEVIKGAKLVDEEVLTKLQKRDKVSGATIGNTAVLPEKFETAHTFICGAAGSGKTVALRRIYLNYFENRETFKAIIHDVKGDWIERFFNPETDYIFNYADIRGMNFNIFTVLKQFNDIKGVVATIIPENNSNSDPIWLKMPRDILEGILHYCIKHGKENHQTVKKMIQMGHEELLKKLKGVKGAEQACIHLSTDEKNISNYMSSFIGACEFFTSLPDNVEGEEFDMIKWLTGDDGRKKSTIFLLNDPDNEDLNAVRISVFVNSIVKKLLTLPDCTDEVKRKIYFFLDECGSLKKMPALEKGTTISRSKGGVFFIGIQNPEKFESTYSKEIAATILNSCSNKLILKANSPSTGEYCSKMIGDVKIKTTSFTSSTGTDTESNREGASSNTQEKIERAVLSSEITNMPENTYYFMAKGYPTTYIEKTFDDRDSFPVIHPAYIERPEEDLRFIHGKKNKDEDETETVEEVSKPVPVIETQPTQNKFESEL